MIRLPRKVLCVDWDRRSLRLVVARVGGGAMDLEDAHSHRLPHSVDHDDAAQMGAFVAQTLKRHRWHHSRVIVDVPRDKSVINRLSLPPTPDDELAAAVRFQAMKELPFPLDEAVIDYVVLKRDSNNLAVEVLLAAVPTAALDHLRETCQAAGLTPARIGLRPYANLIAVRHLPRMAEKRVLFVDVGPNMTEIDVFSEGTLAFSRSANVNVPLIGGEVVTDDSRISSVAELEQIEASDEAIEGAVGELVVEIMRTLQAYRANEPEAVVSQIIVAGGTGVETELLAAVERRFGLQAQLFDPTGVLEAGTGDAVKLRSFPAALGLAWGLGREGSLALDFLNPKKAVPPKEVLKRRMRFAGLAAATVVTAVAAYGVNEYVAQRRDLNRVNREVASLQTERKELAEVEIANRRVDDWATEAVWIDDLLHLTQQMLDQEKLPEEEQNTHMVARGVSLDSRKGTMTVDIECSDYATFLDFIRRVNEVDDGKRYSATESGWHEGNTSDPAFDGEGKVKIELVQLARHHAGRDAREKAMRNRTTIKFITQNPPRKPVPKPTTQPATTQPAGAPAAESEPPAEAPADEAVPDEPPLNDEPDEEVPAESPEVDE